MSGTEATRQAAAGYEAAGLYDPAAPNAVERLALLEWLSSQGATIEQMTHALRHASITGLAADLTLRPGNRLSLEEFSARVGVAPARIEEIRLASGLPPVEPDERPFTDDDAASFLAFLTGEGIFGRTASLALARVIGSSLSRIAEACVSLFLVNVEAPIRETHGGEIALALANLRAIQALGTIPSVMQALLRSHLEVAIRRSRRARLDGLPAMSRLAVGFVDLVGFTPLSRERAPEEIAAVVERFESLANDVITAHYGRVVKLIGDAVMFVAVEPSAACEIALTMVERFKQDAVVTPRGGLAGGPVLTRGGDYYGPVVNIAARIAEQAVPSEILVTRTIADEAVGDRCRFEPAGRRMLKGFPEPVSLYSAERP
jgi:adenylate cyclase